MVAQPMSLNACVIFVFSEFQSAVAVDGCTTISKDEDVCKLIVGFQSAVAVDGCTTMTQWYVLLRQYPFQSAVAVDGCTTDDSNDCII